jgi:hypothetical protein
MKKNNLKSIVLIGLALAGMVITLSNTGCKKKTDDPVDQPKTLNKALLNDKYWYNQGNTLSHYFGSNGKYYNTVGTWQWLNNSDSMEIKYTGGSREVWYFEWSTEHEFSAKPSKNSGYVLFKDQKW